MKPAGRYLVMVLSGILAVTASWAAGDSKMSVQVREAQLRDKPSFLGKLLGTAEYGDRVDLQASQGDWLCVNLPDGRSGWMHNSALTAQKVVLRAGEEQARLSASSDELALAGKGFNSDVEAQFKKNHQNIDFSMVDKMEKIKITPSEKNAFLKAGNLIPQGAR